MQVPTTQSAAVGMWVQEHDSKCGDFQTKEGLIWLRLTLVSAANS